MLLSPAEHSLYLSLAANILRNIGVRGELVAQGVYDRTPAALSLLLNASVVSPVVYYLDYAKGKDRGPILPKLTEVVEKRSKQLAKMMEEQTAREQAEHQKLKCALAAEAKQIQAIGNGTDDQAAEADCTNVLSESTAALTMTWHKWTKRTRDVASGNCMAIQSQQWHEQMGDMSMA